MRILYCFWYLVLISISPYSIAMEIFIYTVTIVAALVTVYTKLTNGQGKISVQLELSDRVVQ